MRTGNALAYDLATIIKKWAAEKSAVLGAEQTQAIVQDALKALNSEFGGDSLGWIEMAVDEYQGVSIQLHEVWVD